MSTAAIPDVVDIPRQDTADAPTTELEVDAYGLTDRGPRSRNEDQFLIAELCKSFAVQATTVPGAIEPPARLRSHLFAVADGVGGNAAGDEASAIAIEAVARLLPHGMPLLADMVEDPGHDDGILDQLREIVARCHGIVRRTGAEHESVDRGRMATTLTIGYVAWPHLFMAHVGDSRCYLVRNASVSLLSRDHTAANGLIERGVDPEHIDPSLHHVLTCAIGGHRGLTVETRRRRLIDGDIVLLCSDGLSNVVSDEEIGRTLLEAHDVRSGCHDLVERALAAGTRDNVTCVAARFCVAAEQRRRAHVFGGHRLASRR